jgi:hypothetical protein
MQFLDIQKEGRKYREALFTLYESAFPEDEKKPLKALELLTEQGKMEILAIEDSGEFIGLAINLFSGTTAILDYFAIADDKRASGYGSAAIRQLTKHFAGQTYIFEIEKQDPDADNAKDRARRKAFYLRNGLKETGIFANVYHTDFELLTPDGRLSYEQYDRFLKEVLGDEYYHFVSPRQLQINNKKTER